MTKTDKQIVEAWGSARIKDGRLQTKKITDIRGRLTSRTVKQAIDFLSTLDPEAKLDIYSEEDYGDHNAYVYVCSYEDVTPEDRAKMVTQIEAREKAQREKDEREFRRLQAARPDLFR